jgi:hypothetical protein
VIIAEGERVERGLADVRDEIRREKASGRT